MKIKLSAVVVFYKPSADNLKNYLNYIETIDKLYVVDNSGDDIKRIKDTSKIKYIKLEENKGIATALNIGATEALKDGYKYLLTMDQDSKIDAKIIEEMLDFLENNNDEKIGLISPYHDIKTLETKPKEKIEEKLEVMTSGNIINLEAYKAINGFKDWLFIDGVDIEYGLNLNSHGYKVVRLNYIVMPHELGAATIHNFLGKKVLCSNHNAIRRYYMIRNTLYINELYKDKYPDYCKFLMKCQNGQIKRVIIFEKDKFQKIKLMIRGYLDFKKHVVGKMR